MGRFGLPPRKGGFSGGGVGFVGGIFCSGMALFAGYFRKVLCHPLRLCRIGRRRQSRLGVRHAAEPRDERAGIAKKERAGLRGYRFQWFGST